MRTYTRLSSKIASTGAERAPLGLERDRLHAARAEAVRHVVQAGERGADVAAGPGPEELGGRRGARPDGVVEVLGAGLLGPEQVLAAEDELRLVRGQVRGGVERVRQLPGLERVAPRVAGGERADPRAVTAVLRGGGDLALVGYVRRAAYETWTYEVEVVGSGVDDLEALLRDGLDVLRRDPDENGGLGGV